MKGSIRGLAIAVFWLSMPATAPVQVQRGQTASTHPNIVLFVVDDLGYGDLSLTGHPTIKTPNVDQMAREGIVLTSFYAAPNCTPARGMLLTARYPPRTGLIHPFGRGFPGGIREDEITLAEALKPLGYRSAIFGKWHLGDFEANPAFHPSKHGFDAFVGIPYPADWPDTPLFQGTQAVERPGCPRGRDTPAD
jgi:arylsulfatase A-like enzyme